jgi:hypothetical protein
MTQDWVLTLLTLSSPFLLTATIIIALAVLQRLTQSRLRERNRK